MGKQVKALETLIRKIVREEIKRGVPKAIQEAMNPKTDHKKVMKQGIKNVQPVREKQEFVKDNPMLNDILNETAMTLGNTQETTEQEVSFTSQNAQGFNRSNLAPIPFIISKNEGKDELIVSVSNTVIGFSVINPKHKNDIAIL